MVRICIFGDSITWGVEDLEKGGWVNRLRHYFDNYVKDENYFIVYNLGVCGDNMNNLIKRFEAECNARFPNIIIFAIGINDAQSLKNKENPKIHLDKFEENLGLLINMAKKYSSTIIFIGLTKIDKSKVASTQYSNENIKKYDLLLKNTSDKNNLNYVYMFDLLHKKDLYNDGLHPNSKGHEKIFNKVKDYLIEKKLI